MEPQSSATPQPVIQPSESPESSMPLFVIMIPILSGLAILGLIVAFILSLQKTKLVPKNTVSKASQLLPTPTPTSIVTITTKYDNPFDSKTQYSNPFDEQKNPFDNLAP